MFNNAHIIANIAIEDERPLRPSLEGPPRDRALADPCLPARLPSAGEPVRPVLCELANGSEAFLQREADVSAPDSVQAELRRLHKALEIATNKAEDEQKAQSSESSQPSPETTPKAKRKSLLDVFPSAFRAAKILHDTSRNSGQPWRAPEVRHL